MTERIHITPTSRAIIEDAIEELVKLLDILDGEVDAEDDGTAEEGGDFEADTADEEPSLGWSSDVRQTNLGSQMGDDLEPSLGWTVTEAASGNYDVWACSDLEDEHDGCELEHGI